MTDFERPAHWKLMSPRAMLDVACQLALRYPKWAALYALRADVRARSVARHFPEDLSSERIAASARSLWKTLPLDARMWSIERA